jgi:lysozyme
MFRRILITVGVFIGAALILFGLCFVGIWIPNEPSRNKYPIRGIDVSHHQGDINWRAVRDSQISFAYIKATEGVDFRDAKFSENWPQSRTAGLTHGAYHFFRLGKPGAPQAANFIATVPVEPDALPPAIDLEFSGYNRNQQPSQADFQRELSIFWDAIVAQYGKTPVVYTTSDFQKHYLAKMPVARLWLREVFLTPRQPWLFWQFSPRVRLRGVPTFVDLNVFNGQLAEFQHVMQTSEQM